MLLDGDNIAGGSNLAIGITGLAYMFHPLTSAWTQVQDMPLAAATPACVRFTGSGGQEMVLAVTGTQHVRAQFELRN